MHTKAKRWLKEDANLLDTVLHEIKRNGPLCSKDFKHEGKEERKQKGGWWNWKPSKFALELLYDAGILMVSRRENFQKYYDLTENVLPSSVDLMEPTEEERRFFFLEKALDAWELAEIKHIAQYFYPWSTRTNFGVKTLSGLINELENHDVVTSVHVEGTDKPYLIHKRDLTVLEKISDAEKQASIVSLISPFDNLTWSKPRAVKLFDHHSILEIYVTKDKRRFGYYALNILYDNQIVGRLDPKMHREEATLEIKALELKDGFKPTRDFKQQLALTLEDFMKFHNTETIKIGNGCPKFLKTADT